MATALTCSRQAEKHGGPLRRTETGLVCQQCWAKEHGITLRKSQHGQIACPNCGKVLMTKLRKGGISITSMNMKGGKATLKCECGYQKQIDNPFNRRGNRDSQALYTLRELEKKRREEAKKAEAVGVRQ